MACNQIHYSLVLYCIQILIYWSRCHLLILSDGMLEHGNSRQSMKLVIVGNTKHISAEGSDTSRKIYDFIESKGSMSIIAN